MTLTDTLPSGISWSEDSPDCSITAGVMSCDFGDLASGQSRTVHVTGETDAADCGILSNTAVVAASNEALVSVGDNLSTATITMNCPEISITKTADQGTVDAGSDIGFTITATNNGDGTAHGVTVTDTLPSDPGLTWTIDPANSDADCSIAAGVLTCTWGDLASGASKTVHITSPTTAASCGTVNNTASVTTSNDGSDSDDASITVQCPAIQIVKGGPALAHVGDTVPYSFDVTNTGDVDLHDVTLTDPICDAGTIQLVDDGDGDAILAVGETWTYTCTHVVTDSDPDPLPNTATVSGTDDNGGTVSDQDSHTVDLIHPAIQIVKTVDPKSGNPGDTVT